MLLTRPPMPALRPFVEAVWASDPTPAASPATAQAAPTAPPASLERVLPTGSMHLAIRLTGPPLQVLGTDRGAREFLGHAVVGGVRDRCYVRDISAPVRSVGAQLRPSAVLPLFDATAADLAGRHTPLEQLWGRSAVTARERLLDAGSLERQLLVFEHLLLERLPRVCGVHPAVAHALAQLSATPARSLAVRDVVRESGYSHRRFIELFRRSVGLTPKRYQRLSRFRAALAAVDLDAPPTWADLALAAGYSDQAHFSREFRAFSGVTPGAYLAARPAARHHVPILDVSG